MSAHTSDSRPPQDGASGAAESASVAGVLVVLLSTAFVMMLNETTVAVALPAIMGEFHVSAATARWLLTGFMLTMAVVMPTTGWMLERFSTRAVFIVAVAAFLLGTLLAALAPWFGVLLLGRLFQGAGTAVVLPLMMAVTMMTLVAASGLLGLARLRNVGAPRRLPLDVVSVVLSVLAFGGLIYGLTSIGQILAGGSAAVVALSVTGVGAVALVLFALRQIRRARTGEVLLDLRPLAVRGFTLPIIVLLILFGAMLGVMNTLPLYLQGSLLATALVAGLALMPGGLVEAVVSPLAGRLFDRVGPRPLIIPGLVIEVGSLVWLSTVDESTAVAEIIAIHVVFSIGLAALFSPLMTTALGSLPRELYGHGSAILNTGQQLAAAAGTAAMIAIYSLVSDGARDAGAAETTALADGANSAFLTSAGLVGIALMLSLFIRAPRSGSRTEIEG
ncbi:MFS transporter [Kocuria palustris]|uniref:MFS transporter n=1 Tax=Kocuria palustris TaxID=71999 RepID=UPI002430A7BF|nr:MFS transporter [Kocuria palustris]